MAHKPKPGLPDGLIPAILRGGQVGDPERNKRVALANTILGFALGAQVDLGRSDDTILSDCKEMLIRIHRASADPAALKALEDIGNAGKPPDER